MKSLWIAFLALFVSIGTFAPGDAEARRFGGGGFSGMQRSLPRAAPNALPARPAPAPAATPAVPGRAAAATAAPKRSWLGPIAGLAAGLGLAALMSHLGFGAEFANFLMIALLGIAALFAIRLVMRRFAPAPHAAGTGGMRFATAGAPAAAPLGALGATERSETIEPAAATAPPAASLPADFDAPAFERIAKMIFIRMQAANDAGDLEDLRAFTTPELFASVRLELQERAGALQQTDVVQVDADVQDVATESGKQIVSVRFHGLIREELDGVATPFDEVWHLVRPLDGSREWAIAGIQQFA